MLQDLQALPTQRFVSGGTNIETGEAIPVIGCLPLPTVLTGLTVTTSGVVNKQLNVTGTPTDAQKQLMIAGNYVTVLGVRRKIRSVNSLFLSITLVNAFPSTLTAQQLNISVRSLYRLFQINNTTSVSGVFNEALFSGNQANSLVNPAGIECIGYDATGTVFEFTVGI